MEVSYKRHFGQSYMIIKGEQEPDETYELSVLAYNRIPGLLPLEIEIADGKARFWYNITGKHTLADELERKPIDSQLLQLLFLALDTVLKETSAYFLEEGNLLVEPEYLYLDATSDTLELVYLPGSFKDLRESFQELMEQLLRRLNHSDKQASDMAYEMYQQSLSREEAFAEMLGKVYEAGYLKVEPKEEMNLGYEAFENREDGLAESYVKPESGPVKGIKNKFKIIRKNVEKSNVIPLPAGKPPLMAELPDSSSEPQYSTSEQFYQPKKEPFTISPTEVLSFTQNAQGILRYQGEASRADIRLGKPVELLGKKAAEVDICIEGKSVSRIHARIEKEEEGYYLEDMNSTNGTFLNGELLEYRQKVKLSPRDRITFGVEEYLFL